MKRIFFSYCCFWRGQNQSLTIVPQSGCLATADVFWSNGVSFRDRLDYQPLFGRGARAPPRSHGRLSGRDQTRHERAAEIEPSFEIVDEKYIEELKASEEAMGKWLLARMESLFAGHSSCAPPIPVVMFSEEKRCTSQLSLPTNIFILLNANEKSKAYRKM